MDGTEADSDRNTSWCRKPSFHAGLTLAMIFNKAALCSSSSYNSYQAPTRSWSESLNTSLPPPLILSWNWWFLFSIWRIQTFIYHFFHCNNLTKCLGNAKTVCIPHTMVVYTNTTPRPNKLISGEQFVSTLSTRGSSASVVSVLALLRIIKSSSSSATLQTLQLASLDQGEGSNWEHFLAGVVLYPCSFRT